MNNKKLAAAPNGPKPLLIPIGRRFAHINNSKADAREAASKQKRKPPHHAAQHSDQTLEAKFASLEQKIAAVKEKDAKFQDLLEEATALQRKIYSGLHKAQKKFNNFNQKLQEARGQYETVILPASSEKPIPDADILASEADTQELNKSQSTAGLETERFPYLELLCDSQERINENDKLFVAMQYFNRGVLKLPSGAFLRGTKDSYKWTEEVALGHIQNQISLAAENISLCRRIFEKNLVKLRGSTNEMDEAEEFYRENKQEYTKAFQKTYTDTVAYRANYIPELFANLQDKIVETLCDANLMLQEIRDAGFGLDTTVNNLLDAKGSKIAKLDKRHIASFLKHLLYLTYDINRDIDIKQLRAEYEQG